MGVLVPIDLSNAQERMCRGGDRPDEADSDYEYWTP